LNPAVQISDHSSNFIPTKQRPAPPPRPRVRILPVEE
jgi:hypothetical protein